MITRLSPAQRLALADEYIRRHFREWTSIKQKDTVVEKIESVENILNDLKATPEQKPHQSFREQVRQNIVHHREQQQQRRSGGIHI